MFHLPWNVCYDADEWRTARSAHTPRREMQCKAMLENFKYRSQVQSVRHHKLSKVIWAAFSIANSLSKQQPRENKLWLRSQGESLEPKKTWRYPTRPGSAQFQLSVR